VPTNANLNRGVPTNANLNRGVPTNANLARHEFDRSRDHDRFRDFDRRRDFDRFRGTSFFFGLPYFYGYGPGFAYYGPGYAYYGPPLPDYSAPYYDGPNYYDNGSAAPPAAYPAAPDANAGGAPANTDTSAHITVLLPDPNAKVLFDGRATTASGAKRTYDSPPLERGRTYTYKVTVTWNQDGNPVTEEREVMVAPGGMTVVDFNKLQAPAPAKP
jgi:uncharacterized protein (TIGR03000 family)